jgi:hypothetical protein
MSIDLSAKRAVPPDDDFSYQFTVENAASFVLPMVGDYIDVNQNASKPVVQRDFHHVHDDAHSRVDITLFGE